MRLYELALVGTWSDHASLFLKYIRSLENIRLRDDLAEIEGAVIGDQTDNAAELAVELMKKKIPVLLTGTGWLAEFDAVLFERGFGFEPLTQTPQLAFAKSLMKSGKMGTVTNIRVRCSAGRSGTACQALARASATVVDLFGIPVQAKPFLTENGLHRNGVVLFEFENKRLGIAETSWSTPEYDYSVDLCATEGWLRIRKDTLSYTLTQTMDRNARWCDVDTGKLEMPEFPAFTKWLGEIRSNCTGDSPDSAKVLAGILSKVSGGW